MPVSPTGAYAAALGAGTKLLGTGIGALARHLSPEGQAEDRQAKKDVEALERNEFGPTRAQQEQMVQDAVGLARQQAQAQRAESARQRAATGYVMGGQQNNDAAIVKAAAATAGEARGKVADWAAQQAAKARQEAWGRVSGRAAKTEKDVAGIFDTGADAAAAAGGLVEKPRATNLMDHYSTTVSDAPLAR